MTFFFKKLHKIGKQTCSITKKSLFSHEKQRIMTTCNRNIYSQTPTFIYNEERNLKKFTGEGGSSMGFSLYNASSCSSSRTVLKTLLSKLYILSSLCVPCSSAYLLSQVLRRELELIRVLRFKSKSIKIQLLKLS